MSVRIVRGTVANLLFKVTAVADAAAVNLTGLPIEFFMVPRKGQGSPGPDLTKLTVDFVLLDQLVAATKGHATLKLSAIDTNLLTVGAVAAALFITESSDRRRVLYEHVGVVAGLP